MNIMNYFKLLREIKSVSFATVDENGHPQVRIIDVMIVEDKKLYFVTARGKDFYKQLIHKKEVAIIGINKEYQTVRLFGKVKKIDQKWVDRVFEENPVMNNIYPGDSRYILEAFCLYEGEGEFFDLSKEPIFRETFSFGNENKIERGFFITDKCIGCSTCEIVCPQKCISKGKPFFINQEQCLHCGLCLEKCPVNAIERINN